MVTITGRFVERPARVTVAPWAASIGIILLLHWVSTVLGWRLRRPTMLFSGWMGTRGLITQF
jgi:hypothetical protein